MIWSSPFLLNAQDNWGDDGEVEDAEIIIEKDKKLELPRFNRFFDKVKFDPASQQTVPIKFQVKDLNFSPVVKTTKIKVLKLKQQKLEKLYNGQIELGYGNFSSPYVDLIYANKREKNFSFGAHAQHLSYGKGPVDEKNSASGTTSVELFGKGYAEAINYYGSVGYNNRFNHYYGYNLEQTTPLKDTINLNFNTISLLAGLSGTNPESPFQYNYEVSFDNLTNHEEVQESRFKVKGVNSYKLNDDWLVGLDTRINISNYQDVDFGLERNQVKVSPYVRFKLSGFLLRGGFNVVSSVDSTNQEADLAIYPDLQMEFPVSAAFDIYGGLKGDQGFNTYNRLSLENPWIQSQVDLRNEITKFEIYGGIRGRIGEKAGMALGFSTGTYENIIFFVNSQPDSALFDLVFDDGNTTVFKLFGQFNYSFDDKAGLQASAELNGYDADQLQEAWHKPLYKLMIGGKYLLFNKLSFKPELMVVGGIEGFNAASERREKLDPVMNLQLRTRYLLSERSSIFMNLDNILGSDNQYFTNYLSRGFQLQAGFSYSF